MAHIPQKAEVGEQPRQQARRRQAQTQHPAEMLQSGLYGWLSKLWSPFGDLFNKDYSIFGVYIGGPLILGKYHMWVIQGINMCRPNSRTN